MSSFVLRFNCSLDGFGVDEITTGDVYIKFIIYIRLITFWNTGDTATQRKK